MSREAIYDALMALEHFREVRYDRAMCDEAIAALRAALSEPVQPVACNGDCVLGHCGSPAGCEHDGRCRADNAAPPGYVVVPVDQAWAIVNMLRDYNEDQMANRMCGYIAAAKGGQ